MKYQIRYVMSELCKLKESLLYMFPRCSEFINNIENRKPNSMNFLLVGDDEICFDERYDYTIPCIYSDTFINAVDLLIRCNDESFVIKIDVDDFVNISKIKTIHYRDYISTNNVVIIDNQYYTISDNEYNLFFNKIKTIDCNTYLRSMKIKQLL